MVQSNTPQTISEKRSGTLLLFLQAHRWTIVLLSMVVLETALVAMALVPAQFWTRVLANAPDAALDGPFPLTLAPLITTLLYVIPTLIGLLCHNWQKALLYATLPAWIGLGVFLVAATLKVGPFYLVLTSVYSNSSQPLELSAGWDAPYSS
jgi:hypothetical protein